MLIYECILMIQMATNNSGMSNVKFPMSKDISFSPFKGEIKRGLESICYDS